MHCDLIWLITYHVLSVNLIPILKDNVVDQLNFSRKYMKDND